MPMLTKKRDSVKFRVRKWVKDNIEEKGCEK